MNYFRHLIESKRGELFCRLIMVCRRFGLTNKNSIKVLQQLLAITDQYGCIPSLFVTADLLYHHPSLTEVMAAHEIDVCLHGHYHIDHSLMKMKAQREEIRKGVETFRKHGIQVSGFRAPFLRFNEDTPKAAMENDLSFVSHTCMLYSQGACRRLVWGCDNARNLVEKFYTRKRYTREPSIPCLQAGCLDIPVSLPDDEILVDRIKIHDVSVLTEVWLDMLEASHRNGELFNFICHPERGDYVLRPLEKLLEKARNQGDVWVASLDDISRWWKKRATSEFWSIVEHDGAYEVKTNIVDESSVALQHPGGKLEFIKHDGSGTFIVHGALKPVIGVSEECSTENITCLRKEGFAVEPCWEPSKLALVLDANHTGNMSHRQLLETVTQAKGPLLRFWRWPYPYESALAVTVDIDALNLGDFIRRAYYFFRTANTSRP